MREWGKEPVGVGGDRGISDSGEVGEKKKMGMREKWSGGGVEVGVRSTRRELTGGGGWG